MLTENTVNKLNEMRLSTMVLAAGRIATTAAANIAKNRRSENQKHE